MRDSKPTILFRVLICLYSARGQHYSLVPRPTRYTPKQKSSRSSKSNSPEKLAMAYQTPHLEKAKTQEEIILSPIPILGTGGWVMWDFPLIARSLPVFQSLFPSSGNHTTGSWCSLVAQVTLQNHAPGFTLTL